MLDLMKDPLYVALMDNGFTHFVNPLEPLHAHAACEPAMKKFYEKASGEHSYTMEVGIFDLHKIPKYPRTHKRFVFEVTIRFYGNNAEGDSEIPQTTVTYVMTSYKQATDHAKRLWGAMGHTTE